MSKADQMTTADLVLAILKDNQTRLGTSIPGHVTAFDPATQLAQLQIGVRSSDGVQLPIIIECPVQFAGGSAFVVEHQIDPGDEGIVVFSQRCIDGWLETGGVAEQLIPRMHDFTDAYFIPGIRSKPNAVPIFQNNGIILRDVEGTKYIWLKGNGDIDIAAGTVTIVGDLTATTIAAETSLTAAGAEVVGHVHGGVESGPDSTGPLV